MTVFTKKINTSSAVNMTYYQYNHICNCNKSHLVANKINQQLNILQSPIYEWDSQLKWDNPNIF